MKISKILMTGLVVASVLVATTVVAYLTGKSVVAQDVKQDVKNDQIDPQASVIPPGTPGSLHAELARLETLDEKEQEAFLRELSEDWKKSMGVLLLQIGPANQNQVRCAAAFFLGLYRYEQAVSSLADVITLRDDKSPRIQQRLWYWGQYPAAEALVKIGNRSIPAMVQNLETSDDRKVRELSLRVIRVIQGREVAEFIVQRAVDRQEEPLKKAYLKKALDELKSSPIEKAG